MLKRFIVTITSLMCTIFICAYDASAQKPDQQPYERLQNSLQKMQHVDADILQINPDGSKIRGTVKISRPGRMWLEYNNNDIILADGLFLHYWQAQDKDVSSLPLQQLPLNFLLNDTVNIRQHAVIEEVHLDKSGRSQDIFIKMHMRNDPEAGKIILRLSPQNDIRGWSVIDALNNVTTVKMTNHQYLSDRKLSQFRYENLPIPDELKLQSQQR